MDTGPEERRALPVVQPTAARLPAFWQFGRPLLGCALQGTRPQRCQTLSGYPHRFLSRSAIARGAYTTFIQAESWRKPLQPLPHSRFRRALFARVLRRSRPTPPERHGTRQFDAPRSRAHIRQPPPDPLATRRQPARVASECSGSCFALYKREGWAATLLAGLLAGLYNGPRNLAAGSIPGGTGWLIR
jgi:hypothetical protein